MHLPFTCASLGKNQVCIAFSCGHPPTQVGEGTSKFRRRRCKASPMEKNAPDLQVVGGRLELKPATTHKKAGLARL